MKTKEFLYRMKITITFPFAFNVLVVEKNDFKSSIGSDI